ncbi:MAG: acyl-CoA synthetase FdrA [Chloroflexi bacterium]|nr:acyl-CoA synthetase FdrA [Chloroflexota bacterium]
MALAFKIKPKFYQDSVRLMRISERLSDLENVRQAIVAMGTEANKRVLAEINLLIEGVETAAPNDLMIVVEAESDAVAESAIAQAETILAEGIAQPANGSERDVPLRTLAQARARLKDANLMMISVAGNYAALEAAKALHGGMHVFLFSDNVTLDEERRLKELAASKGLLMMGPGCGTAVINGVGLAFANALKRGPVGIVGASGTGLQELTTLIDRGGTGISQAIGVGGRDLSERIGGIMMRQGIAMLAADPQTEIIVLISKPPHPSVTERILEAASASGKPVIVNFLGDKFVGEKHGIHFTGTIEDTAEAVLQCVNSDQRVHFASNKADISRQVAQEREKLSPGQGYLRGLFSGGTLCDEAMDIFHESLPGVYSNIALSPQYALESGWQSREHSCIDMGEEEFTQGRPHPMIDLRLRQERILKEAADPQVAVILLDVVIGYGAHENPAQVLGETIRQARMQAAGQSRYLAVVAHVCGTEQDFQGLPLQEAMLREAGALVLPTNAQAARAAAAIVTN